MQNTAGSDAPRPVSELLALWHAQSEDFAVVFMDLNAVVVAANPAVNRVLGYAPEELLGDTLRRIFTEEDLAQGLDKHELEVATRLGRAEDDRWHIGKDDRRVWISGVMVPLLDEDGKHFGFAKLLRDRTDLRTELASLENRLQQADEKARQKNELLSTVGHELRNPLHTLEASIEVLRRVQVDRSGDAEKMLAVATRQIAVVKRMLDDLREAARLDIGRLKLELAPVSLQGAIRAAVSMHVQSAVDRHQTLDTILPGPDIVILVDPVRLEQIIRNLLDNAIKYTPEGGAISVTATVEGTMAVMRVQDDGIGLSPDMLPRIFDLFTREDRVIDSAAEGLGIGLALVKKLVTTHGGLIQVQTAGPGKGTEFTVRLPLQSGPVEEPPRH